MFGAAAMSLSSFCVVTNALRLNLFKLYDTKKDNRKRTSEREEQRCFYEDKVMMEEMTMIKTMKIEGMMCGHCEARVKKCLEALPEVTEAVVSHEQGTAVLTLSSEIADDVLKKTVEEQDYTVLEIQ